MQKAVLIGMSLFLVLGFVLFASADIFKADVELVDADPVAPVITTGESVLYYLSQLNSKLLTTTTQTVPTPEEVARELSEKSGGVKGSRSDTTATGSGGTTVAWTNLIGTQESTIVFPKTNNHTLSLTFSKSRLSTIRYIKVLVDGGPVDCYFSVGSSILNALGGQTSLVYGLSSKETCDYAIDGKYVVTATLAKSGDYYSFNVTSPLIPPACAGKTFNQTDSTLTVQCS